MNELQLLEEADKRGRCYIANVEHQRVYPTAAVIDDLARFDEPLPRVGSGDFQTLALMDEVGSPATSVSNGPRYFGFVIGATLPIAAAAERIVLAWDQCASSFDNSPVADVIEKQAAKWILEILDLPRQSAVSFGTSASACGLACLTAARRKLLQREGWNFDRQGLGGAPEIRVIVPQTVHVTVLKALRLLGFGLDNIIAAEVDEFGRIDPERLPALDQQTILCLQAGEVNSGEFDRFEPLIEKAKQARAWVHIDGAFGLWARASPATRELTNGIEGADSWTTDAHKWLNTPYDGAMGICRDAETLAEAMNSDAAYSIASAESQKNMGIDFSRRARGIPIWATLRSLGREGVADLVEKHCRQARSLGKGLEQAGFKLLNRIQLNQVLIKLDSDTRTRAMRQAAIDSGEIWFGQTSWQGEIACRLSLSSWRTRDEDVERTIEILSGLNSADDNSYASSIC